MASQDTDTKSKDAQSQGGGESGGGEKDSKEIKVARTETNAALLTNLRQHQAYRRAAASGASGTGAAIWTAQRLTALALIPLALWFLATLLVMLHAPAPQAAHWFGAPWNAVLLGAFVLIGLRHATIGLRVILEDYVHSEGWRAAAIGLLYLVAAITALAAIGALLVLVFTYLGG